jgi:Arc/MetJ-type ribon-helix-helix transcriptional regulator
MASGLSPENERFLDDAVRSGSFHTRDEALDEAVTLLRDRQAVLQHIDEGTRQIRRGEGIELQGEDELRAFFDELEAEGMERYQARKNRA